MKQRGSIALAIGLGYLLGRKRKLSTALAFGAAAATGQLPRGPLGRFLGGEAGGAAAGQASSLTRLGGAGKAAARTALGRPLERLTERLDESAEALRQTGQPRAAAGGQQQGGQQPQEGQQQGGQQPQEAASSRAAG
jgi:hypothetical protein